MNAHAMPSAHVIRLPMRPRPHIVVASPALDRLVADRILESHHRAAALAYGNLRRRYERSGGPMRSWRDR